jgi:hypothetical protein
MFSVMSLACASFCFAQTDGGAEAREVVKVITGGRVVPFQHAEPDEFAERILRVVRFRLPYGGGCERVEGVGEDS